MQQIKFNITVTVAEPTEHVPYYEAQAQLDAQARTVVPLAGIGKTEQVAVRRAVYAVIQRAMKNKIYYNPDQLQLLDEGESYINETGA